MFHVDEAVFGQLSPWCSTSIDLSGDEVSYHCCECVQIVPGEKANDKLFILEDSDGDGRADKTKVFAENLDMPTGFALGNGGVYIGEGTDLVFLQPGVIAFPYRNGGSVVAHGLGASINGQDPRSNVYLLDGTLMTKPGCLTPLPLSGVPGWWPEEEQNDGMFYDDPAVFRAAPANLVAVAVLEL